VRTALAWKGIEYEYIAVHLVKDGGEQLKETYAAINPMKAVPTFVDTDGFVISQSSAIIEYLEETHPDRPLLPSSPKDRASVRRLCECISCDIQPRQNLCVLKAIGDEKKMEWGKQWIDYGFQALEKLMETSAGKYSYGDNVTMADLFLVPQVYNAKRFSVDMSQYPIISRVHEALEQLPEFQKSHPSQMPDAE